MKRILKEHDTYYEIVENGKVVYRRWNDGYSYERTYDDNGNRISYKDSDGNSYESTYDEQGNILTKIVNGKLTIDNRKTELTMQDIADKFNIDIDKLKIKK